MLTYSGLPSAGCTLAIATAGSDLTSQPISSVQVNDTAGTFLPAVPAAGIYQLRAYGPSGTFLGSSSTFQVVAPIEAANTAPLLAISGGTGINQSVRIVQGTPSDFFSGQAPWTLWAGLIPFYDTDRNDQSDISFGFQTWPSVLVGGEVIAREHPDSYWDFSFARTGVGVNGAVCSCRGGRRRCHGWPRSDLQSPRRVLPRCAGATEAMNFDGGLSTEMVLWGSTGPRHVNTITGEDARIQNNPFTQPLIESPQGFGTVDNYVRVGQ